MRRPISFVRSVTDTSMMFAMLMPPTNSDTEATAVSRSPNVRTRALARVQDLRRIPILKSSDAL
jgi:hypothetical protein